MMLAIALLAANLASGASIDYVKKVLDSPLDDIQWIDNKVLVLSDEGLLYRSADGGRSWHLKNSQLPKIDEARGVASIDISPKDHSHVFLRGQTSGNWFSKDNATTFKYSPLDLHDVRLHPTQKDWILGSSKACVDDACFTRLHFSKNFGQTWTDCLDYVVQFDWSPPVGEPVKGSYSSDDLIYATVHEHKVGAQRYGFWDKNIHFVSTRDYFKTQSTLVSHGNRFLFGDYSYLFVATVNPLDETEVTLEISRDNETHVEFHTARLPVQLTEHSYTILDTSEGAVFLHVNHIPFAKAADTGHVYMSDWSGLRYTLSLPYNHRAADGKCDFEKIEGLEGIYMANFVDVEAEEDIDEEAEEAQRMAIGRTTTRTQTVISFDKGAVWNYLATPKNLDGQQVTCSSKKCHLQLHGITDYYGPFYSTESAVGIIVSTGTVGEYLRSNDAGVNTYLSRDAGLSWTEIAVGSHIYEIGDHGGLIVMAADDVNTNEIKYSWDEGATWTSKKISEDMFQVENIIIEPTSTGQEFIIYGWLNNEGVLIYVDFSELHQRVCTGHDTPGTHESDYEVWTPTGDDRTDNPCILGHTLHYVRRKQLSQCFNPEKFERPVETRHCACTRTDYECDYGFEEADIEGGPCQESELPPLHSNPSKHKDGSCKKSHRITKGYRRVPGDSCTGGAEWEAITLPCPSEWLGGSRTGKAVLIILGLVAVSLLVVTVLSRFDTFHKCSLKDRLTSIRYKIVGENDDEQTNEAFFLDEDAYQTAQMLPEDDDEDLELEAQAGESQFGALPARSRPKRTPQKLVPPPTG